MGTSKNPSLALEAAILLPNRFLSEEKLAGSCLKGRALAVHGPSPFSSAACLALERPAFSSMLKQTCTIQPHFLAPKQLRKKAKANFRAAYSAAASSSSVSDSASAAARPRGTEIWAMICSIELRMRTAGSCSSALRLSESPSCRWLTSM